MSRSWLLISVVFTVCVEASDVPESQVVHTHQTKRDGEYEIAAGTRTVRDIDECTGQHSCHPDARCTNIAGSYQCACVLGFRGNGVHCSDINECAEGLDNCHNDANCKNTAGSFSCTCKVSLTGDGQDCKVSDAASGAVYGSIALLFLLLLALIGVLVMTGILKRRKGSPAAVSGGDYADIPEPEPPHIYEEIDTGDHTYTELCPDREDHIYYELCSDTVDIEVTDNAAYGVGQIV